MQSDIDYYRTRAAEERARAAAAADPAVRRAHEAMAERYERGAAGEKLDLGIVTLPRTRYLRGGERSERRGKRFRLNWSINATYRARVRALVFCFLTAVA